MNTILSRLRFLSDYGSLHKSTGFILVSLSLLSILFETFGLGLLLPVLDFIGADGNTDQLLKTNVLWGFLGKIYAYFDLSISLGPLALTILFTLTARQIFDYHFSVRLGRTEAQIQKQLRLKLHALIQNGSLRMLESLGSGYFLNLMDHQCKHSALIFTGYVKFAKHIFTFGLYGALIIITAPISSGISIGILAALLYFVQYFIKKTKTLSSQLVTAQSALSSFLVESYKAFRTVKLFGVEEKLQSELNKVTSKQAELSVEVIKISNRIPLFMSPVIAVTLMSFLYISVTYLDMTVNTITLFVLILLRLAPAAQSFAQQQEKVARLSVSLKTLNQIFTQYQQSETQKCATQVTPVLKENVTFDAVSYRYADDLTPAVHHISLNLNLGQVVAIKGSSGAGKSTLVDLLSGLIKPQEGQIKFDHVPVTHLTTEDLRPLISYAAQEPFLFRGTVSDNVKIGNPAASEEEVFLACQHAYASEFIERLPHGYDTYLGENGGTLSGGQKQRLALARCFLKKAPILILDEPTSALDPVSEEEIRKAIRYYATEENALVILITHRDTTIRDVDSVIYMENGEIIEFQHKS